MTDKICPYCNNQLYDYKKYLYCYACSKQFKITFFGKMKEMARTIESDQKRAMGR